VSVFFPTVERHSLGGWPDGITPGFVEHGTAPTSGSGLQAPIGSIAKVGPVYYLKTGAGATAWQILGQMAAQPTLRSTGQWHIWGQDLNVNGVSADTAAGTNPAADGNNVMWAVPHWFPESVTITSLAMGLENDLAGGGGQGVPIGGEHAWIGLARDTIVASEHWPGATLAGSAVRVVGSGAGARKLRGGAVSITFGPNELGWQVGQCLMTAVAGAELYGMPMGNWPAWGGVDDLRGLVIGDSMPAARTAYSSVGYCSAVGTLLTYTLGRDFPATGRRLRAKNDGDALANQLFSNNMPIVLFQISR
jgi:hypothetical protein